MTYQYVSRRCTVRDDTKAYTEKKFKKLEKFFEGDCVVHVVFTYEKEDRFTVEVTVDYGGLIFRAQATDTDFKYCIYDIVDLLIRQIRKHKTKLSKRLKDSSFVFDSPVENEPEDSYRIVRSKTVSAKPMSPEEAILQMNLLGHDFFIFRTADERVAVLYRRRNGDYGLIETE